MRSILVPTLLIACVAPLAGCGSGSSSSSALSAPTAPTISLESLRSAPTSVSLSSTTLKLSATLFLNSQPIIGSTGGNQLDGVVTISSSSGALPAGLAMVSAYTVQGSSYGSFSFLTPVTGANALEGNVAEGPKLTAGTTAAVDVLFKDAGGNEYLVQDPSVLIVGAD